MSRAEELARFLDGNAMSKTDYEVADELRRLTPMEAELIALKKAIGDAEPVAWMHESGHVQVRAPYLSKEAVNAYSTNGQWARLYTLKGIKAMKDIELPPLPETEYSLCVLDEEGGIQELDNAGYTEDDMKFYARAIESAATAPLLARIAELERELTEARKDTERLDYIQKNARNDPKMDGNHVWWPTTFNKALKGPTIRAAIDAASKEQECM